MSNVKYYRTFLNLSYPEIPDEWCSTPNKYFSDDHDDWPAFIYWIQKNCAGEVIIFLDQIQFEFVEDRTKFILTWEH